MQKVEAKTPNTRVIGPQPGKQALLVSCPADEIFYGGERGGGKSYGVLLDWAAHEARYGANAHGWLIRKSLIELRDLIRKSYSIFPWLGATYRIQDKIWVFPSGAQLEMVYLDSEKDAAVRQGQAATWIAVDEAGNYPDISAINLLRACLRSASGVRVRLLLTGNPGGAGHNWLKMRYIDPAPEGTPIRDEYGIRVFIHSSLKDNPALLENDPEYIERIKQACEGKPWLLRAWLKGDWNIVAGGMFDAVWNPGIHIVRPFPIPHHWRVDRAFDWGSSKPFSVGWFAESNGESVTLPDGKQILWPKGTLVQIAEWYGWTGKPNEGQRLLNADIARGILQREKAIGVYGRTSAGPADSAIFAVTNGTSIADEMAKHGVNWLPSDKGPGSRVNGWSLVTERLCASTESPMERPGLFVFSTCRQTIRTLPTLPRDEKNPDDVDSNSEDHIGDMIRYRITQRSGGMRAQKTRGLY